MRVASLGGGDATDPGNPPLHAASTMGAVRTRLLLEAEAAVDARDKYGNTPLHLELACRYYAPAPHALVPFNVRIHRWAGRSAVWSTPLHLSLAPTVLAPERVRALLRNGAGQHLLRWRSHDATALRVQRNGKEQHLGNFSSASEAALAYARHLGPEGCAAATAAAAAASAPIG